MTASTRSGAVKAEDVTKVPDWVPEDLLGKTTFRALLFSDDYRLIALKGILAALMMVGLAGVAALTFRVELTVPGIQYLSPRPYIGLVTLHGMLMVFGFVIPLAISVGYYMLPKLLQLERLEWSWAAHGSFWTLLLAALLLIIGRPDFTWTFYAPMSLRVGGDLVWMGYLAIILVGIPSFSRALHSSARCSRGREPCAIFRSWVGRWGRRRSSFSCRLPCSASWGFLSSRIGPD